MKRPRIYTLNGCTLEVACGGQGARATRHATGESAEFRVIAQLNAPTPQVQAERWAMGITATPAVPIAARAATEPEKPKGRK